MKMKNTFISYFCLIIFLLIITLDASAEIPRFSRFDKITQKDGLSSNHVLCIFQEKTGWMWIGTNLGLNRYDGYHFNVYKSDVDGQGTLHGELVRCIFEDKDNQIWIGTEHGGLNLFNRETEQFSHFLFEKNTIDTVFSVNSIVADANNRILLGTSKGVAYLNKSNHLQLLPVDVLAEAGNPEVTKIFCDKKNQLWIGTTEGLYVYDLTLKKGKKLLLPATDRPNDEINSLFFDSDNILWIGTYNSGVYTANVNSQVIRKLDSWVKFSRSETIRSIIEDSQGIIWFGTRGGLVAYDKVTQEYASFLRSEDEILSLSLNSILSLCVDSKGDLWVGTRGGINYRDKDKQVFQYLKASKNDNRFLNNPEIYCFYINNNDLLIGTENGGVNIYDMNTHHFRYLTSQEGLSSDCVKSFVRDGEEILIGTYQGGITVADASTYRVKKILRHQKDNQNTLRDDIVWSLLKDSRGNIWVATNRGVDLYDSKNKTFHYCNELFHEKYCYWIVEDKSGDLWMGGDELVIYNPESKKIIRYKERTRDVIPALEKNQFWVATRGHGLALYDKEKGPIRYFTEADGLCNNNIQSLKRDAAGVVWISTMNGLSRFDEKNKSFINFDAYDGLQDNQFNYGAAINFNTNLIYGGINGVNIFDPSEVRRNSFIPQIVLTGLKIFNQPVKIGSILKKSINVAREIELGYKQNVFSIEFAALSYTNSSRNEYMYMMEGFDQNWIYAGVTNSATYTNLDPGKYTFKVKGSNSNGVWNEKGATIEIIIKPPFWKTWWFRSGVGIIAFLFLLYLANFYLRRARLRNELVFEKTKARKLHEIESIKLRFFTNISHEIRTPLTLILGPLSQVLEQGSVDADSKNKLQLVKRNADQLLKLINQLLDFRKLEAGKQSVHYEKSDVVFYVRSIVDSFYSMAMERDISLTFSSNRDHFLTWYDNDKLQKILNNLISNALKFTNPSGKTSVSFTLMESYSTDNPESQLSYVISVKDTGKGIPAKNLNKIFDRFEQAANSKNTTGSGIGLSIVRDFVKLMGGEIEVESNEGLGSDFIVRLPVLSDADVNQENLSLEVSEKNILNEEVQKIILIVEDNPDVREYVASNFRSEFKVLEAENGKDGFDLAVKYIPDIIISDLLMPIMNGNAFCKKIKKDEHTSHIPFILLTAVTSKESEKDALKSGADDYITKPFDVNILKLKVDNLLSLRNTLREKYKNDFLLQPSSVILVSPDEKFLKKAVDIIEKNIDDSDFDIETFASEIGVSRMQLYRKLEALTSMTVKEFIRDIRIKRAAQLLEQNKASVSEIIYQVGFKDLAYFRKCFREQYGMSPSEYAAKFKE